jgi:putative membrane protein insertion efficiency factor
MLRDDCKATKTLLVSVDMKIIDKILGTFVVGLLLFYRRCVSPFLPHMCRFDPSCSVYMLEAVRKYGVFLGVIKGICRLCRCHPWNPGGHDPP